MIKNKAIFLDRDGVLNREIGNYVTRVEDFEVLNHVPFLLKKLKDAGYLLIVITNQGGIAKDLYTHDDLKRNHQILINKLSEMDVLFTDIFYCPHHPEIGKCLCRKPESIMLEKAIAKHHIDIEQSYMIGDTDRDIQAALAVGVKSFKIDSNADWGSVVDSILK